MTSPWYHESSMRFLRSDRAMPCQSQGLPDCPRRQPLENEALNSLSAVIAAARLLGEALGPAHPAIGYARLIEHKSRGLHRLLRCSQLRFDPAAVADRNEPLFR